MIRLSQYYREKFGFKIFRIPVNAGFVCPHQGCAYCENSSFSPVAEEQISVQQQIEKYLRKIKGREPRQYCVYFQPNSNTNAALPELESAYEQVFGFDMVKGVAIGTRPDCIDVSKLDFIQRCFEGRYFVEMEYGLQSSHERTLTEISRGHTAAQFQQAVELTSKYPFDIVAHVILFLPGETTEDMLATADFITSLPVKIVKIHSIYIPKNSRMYADYVKHPFALPHVEEYIDVLGQFIERLRDDIVVARICSDVVNPEQAVLPWTTPKSQLYQMLEKRLAK